LTFLEVDHPSSIGKFCFPEIDNISIYIQEVVNARLHLCDPDPFVLSGEVSDEIDRKMFVIRVRLQRRDHCFDVRENWVLNI